MGVPRKEHKGTHDGDRAAPLQNRMRQGSGTQLSREEGFVSMNERMGQPSSAVSYEKKDLAARMKQGGGTIKK